MLNNTASATTTTDTATDTATDAALATIARAAWERAVQALAAWVAIRDEVEVADENWAMGGCSTPWAAAVEAVCAALPPATTWEEAAAVTRRAYAAADAAATLAGAGRR